jgi:hypothetical protein
MSRPTELTMEVSVMNGVQKALQRTRRRSSLSSFKLFFGNGLSTIFDKDRKLIYGFSGRFASCLSLVYYEHMLKSNRQASRPQILLVNQDQFDYKKTSCPRRLSSSTSITIGCLTRTMAGPNFI